MQKHEHPDLSFLEIDIRLVVPLCITAFTTLCWALAPGLLIPVILVIILIACYQSKQRQRCLVALIFLALQTVNIQARNIPVFFSSESSQWQATVLATGSRPHEYKIHLSPVSTSLLQYQTKAKLKVTKKTINIGDKLLFTGNIKHDKFGLMVSNPNNLRVSSSAGKRFVAHENIRNHLAAQRDESDTGLFLGITYGDDSLISQNDRENFRAVGITHLTAVSGSNIALVASSTFTILALLFRRRPPALLGMITVTFAYCFFVGLDGSVIRAFIFALLGFLAAFSGSTRSTFALCCSALTLLLLFQPLLLWDVGFILSATITLGLVLICPPLTFILTNYVGELGASFFAVNLVAHIISTPISAFYFEQIYTYSLFVNIVVAPLIPVILGLGIIYLLIYIFFNYDAVFLFDGVAPLLHLIQRISAIFTGFTGSVLEIHHLIVLVVLSLGALCISCIIVRSGRRLASQTPEPIILI